MKTFLSKKLIIGMVSVLLSGLGLQAQMITTDPLHTGVTTLIKFFQEPSFAQMVGNIKKLVQISKFIKNASKAVSFSKEAQTTMKLINAYGKAFQSDRHLLPADYAMISKDFQSVAKEVGSIIEEMADVIQPKGSTMDDGKRLEIINTAYVKLQKLNTGLQSYVNRVSYLSARRSFSVQDKLTTARLYNAAASHVYADGSSGIFNANETEPSIIPFGTDNKGMNYQTEQKMAMEMTIAQQNIFEDFTNKMNILDLEAKSIANLAIPKITEKAFYARKIKEGACPAAPTPPQTPAGGTWFKTEVRVDTSGGGVGKVEFSQVQEQGTAIKYAKDLKEWEYFMEEICGPMWEAYNEKIDLERKQFIRAAVEPERLKLQTQMQEAITLAQNAIKAKYKGQTLTVAKDEEEYYGDEQQK